jgi:integrase
MPRVRWSRIHKPFSVAVIDYKGRRPFGLRWQELDGRHREIGSKTFDRREADRLAALLEMDLANGQVERTLFTWQEFRRRYEAEALSGLSRATATQFATAANRYEKVMSPRHVRDVSKSSLSKFVAHLRDEGLAAASIRSYLGHLRAALSWACDMDMLPTAPRIRMPRGSGIKRMRSLPINATEFEAILAAVPKVRPDDPEPWRQFLRGLWHSGLRVDELRRLSWEPSADLWLTTNLGIPMIRALAEGHKARRDCYQPITIDFWQLVECCVEDRRGHVFPLPGAKGRQMTNKRVVRNISAIGAASGVVTDPTTGKLASSHDIGRRSFLTRMDETLSMAELQKWARHASPETTMAYYHHRSAIELAKKVGWTQPTLDL